MLKQFFIIGFVIVFCSCGRRERDEEFFVEAFGEQLDNSAEYISKSTDNIYLMLQNSLYDSKTKYKAEFWYPKAKKVQLEFNSIYKNIDSLRDCKQIDIASFIKKVTIIKNNLLQFDPEIGHEYLKELSILLHPFDSLSLLNNGTYFDDFSNSYKQSILSKVRCNCKMLENNISNFCLSESKVFGFCFFWEQEFFHVGQNYSHLKVGETLKIQTAVMKTLVKANERIKINGVLQGHTSGVATYELKVSGDTGLHKIPVEITFVDENGKAMTKTNDVEYTIDQ
jgi:hypothetical protein